MKRIIGICLGIVSLMSATPAVAQGFYMRGVVKNISKLNELDKGTKGFFNVFEKELLVPQATSFSRAAQIERWVVSQEKIAETAALSWPEKTILFSQTERFIPKQKVKDILTNTDGRPSFQGTKEQDEFYLIGFPEQVLEEKFLPSTFQLHDATSYYRTRLIKLDKEPFSLRKWGKAMALITDLGLFGNAQDAKAIINTASQFHEELAGISDLIATRALINLGRYEEVESLAKIRLLEKTPEGKYVKLAAQWKQIKEYMDQANVTLDIDVERRVAAEPVTLSENTSRFLQQYNPYNLLQEDAGKITTDFWLDLRQSVDARLSNARTCRQIAEHLDVSSSIFQTFNKITLENLKEFVETNGHKPRVSFAKGAQDESTLATRVQNILNNYDVNSPEVQAINQIYRDLESRQVQQAQTAYDLEQEMLDALVTPEQVLDRLSAFRKAYNRKPRLRHNADLTKLSQYELAELALATRVKEVLQDGNPKDLVIRGIKSLLYGKKQKPKPESKLAPEPEIIFNFPQLSRELSAFIKENLRRPRGQVHQAKKDLSILDKEELKLHQQVSTALKQGDPGSQTYQDLLELWESAPAMARPNSELIKQKLELFREKHNGLLPRTRIFRDGKLLKPNEYTRQEAQEVALAQMLYRVWNSYPQDDVLKVWLRETGYWRLYK